MTVTKAWFKILWLPVVITLILFVLKVSGLLLVSYLAVFIPIIFALISMYVIFLVVVGAVLGIGIAMSTAK
jgi:hypothetical protein